MVDVRSDKAAAEELTNDLFGDVISKITYMFNKDKKSVEKLIKEKRHGH